MLCLGNSTNDLVNVITGSAADLEVSVSYVDYNETAPPVVQQVDGEPLASITSATTTTILAGAASTRRVIKGINLFNRSATSTTVLVQHNDASDTVGLVFATLLQNEALVLSEAGLWVHYDANGAAYPAIGNAASQAEMEAGTATDRYVTPQGMNWHPGVCKAWAKHAVSGGVPQMSASWNVTSVTDSAVCRAAPVIATDFSSSSYSISYAFECNTTTYSATTVACILCIRNASQAAGGFTMDLIEIDVGQTTDPAAWHWQAYGDQ